VVTDTALGVTLQFARKAVGDSGSAQSIIKTTHGRGYQFIAEIQEPAPDNSTGVKDVLSTTDTLKLPDLPSIAVLPFTNASDDSEDDYFSDGITDDIINGLTPFRDLFVMGRSSCFFFRDKAVEITEIGRQLGVQYLVQGTVRRHDEKLRITVELVDAVTGQNLWAERYERELKDVFAVEDEVSSTIVAAVITRVEDSAYKRSQTRTLENLAAYDWLLRGNRLLERGGTEDLFEARRMYERAVELDPEFAAAYAGLSKTYSYEYWDHLAEDHHEVLKSSLEYGQKAVALDDKDSRAHYAVSNAYICEGRHEQAEFHVEKALALNPGEYHNLCMKGYLLACTGRHDESRTCLTDSLRHNPFAPNSCLLALGISDYLAHRYENATVMLTRLSSDLPRKLSCLAASYAQLGRDAEARATATEIRDMMEPGLAAMLGEDRDKWRDYWLKMFSIFRSEDFEHLLEGLRKAGLPA
jgi:TolB-like protein/Flp pilus assembly protein TadD